MNLITNKINELNNIKIETLLSFFTQCNKNIVPF